MSNLEELYLALRGTRSDHVRTSKFLFCDPTYVPKNREGNKPAFGVVQLGERVLNVEKC